MQWSLTGLRYSDINITAVTHHLGEAVGCFCQDCYAGQGYVQLFVGLPVSSAEAGGPVLCESSAEGEPLDWVRKEAVGVIALADSWADCKV